ncbi:DUF4403 domain-containing protein containing protein [Pelomyxa schiedti]|nr:DUF4403 domain-containing protein containing protein [Pelomyxa schiedti]
MDETARIARFNESVRPGCHTRACRRYGTKKVVVSVVALSVFVVVAVVVAVHWSSTDWQGLTELEIPAPAGFSTSVPVQGRDSTIPVKTDLNIFSLAVPRLLDQWVNLDGGSLHYLLQSDGSPDGTTLTINFSGKRTFISFDNGDAMCTVSGVSSPTPGTVKLELSCAGSVTLVESITRIWGKTCHFTGTLSCTAAVSLANDWHLISNPKVQVSVARAKAIFGLSGGGFLEGLIDPMIPQIEAWMAERLYQVPIHEKLNWMWEHFHSAIQIRNVELPHSKVEDLWLQVNPNTLSVSPLTFSGVWMHVSIGLSCQPVMALGYNPASSSPGTECPSFSTVISDRGVDAALKFHLPYTVFQPEASRLLPTIIRPASIIGARMRVNSLNLYTSGIMLVAAVEVDALSQFGNATGTVYLWGKLQWNSASSTLSVTDVDFHPETKQYIEKMFVGASDWLLHDSLKELISSKLNWNLGPHLEKLRHHLTDKHKSYSWVDYNFVLHNLDVQSVVAEDSGITLVGSITGQGSLSVKSLP